MGTDTSIVVPLLGSLLCFVRQNFVDKGLSEDNIQTAITQFETWYWIVDGDHAKEAVRWLVTNGQAWKSYKWFVTVLKGGFGVDRYRQLARFNNHHHNKNFYIEIELFDELKNLREEHGRLSKLTNQPTNVQVAKAYFGSEAESSTTTICAPFSARLPIETLPVLESIVNAEHPEICLQSDDIDTKGAQTLSEVL